MKKFTNYIVESANVMADVKPGNSLLNTGVANHYTPVQNILTNIKNLFCSQLGIVAEIAEDGLSIKLSSSQFVSPKKINDLLWRPLYNDVSSYDSCSLYGYITSQGLRKVTKISLGAYYVVYFSPEDIKAAQNPISMEPDAAAINYQDACGCECTGDCSCPCPCEALESVYDEFEILNVNEEEDKSTEFDDITNISNIINNSDKIVAAKQLDMIISQKIKLPRDYYFSSVKFKNGDEAIALRWKYEKQLPTGKSTENTRSLIHIFNTGVNGIWVQDFAEDSIVKLPDDVVNLINDILKAIGAQETDNPSLFSLLDDNSSTKNDLDDTDEKIDDKEETTDDKDNEDEK